MKGLVLRFQLLNKTTAKHRDVFRHTRIARKFGENKARNPATLPWSRKKQESCKTIMKNVNLA